METPVLEFCTGLDSGNLGSWWGGGGGGGGLLQKFYDGVCGPNFEDTPNSQRPSPKTIPIHII